MQYFKPPGDFFVGDCMPFFHAGVFHLYYLLDEQHHQALQGLGGHQWAHASTTDLVNWQHHPLALPITAATEGSICTGTVFFHDGIYYAFYATRTRDWRQHLSLATSRDGVHFVKEVPDLFAPPQPAYSPFHFRDPLPFQDPQTGLFHLLVSAQWLEYPLPGRGGCLAHLVSADLYRWQLHDPFLIPGFDDVPECCDWFCWNGWYYLLFSNALTARYRMARSPLGPWQCPPVDVLDGPLARVMKTAPFDGNRRIGVAWLGTRQGESNEGHMQWGGHTLFRELVQHADGTLGCTFAPELQPTAGSSLLPALVAVTPSVPSVGAPGGPLQVQLDGCGGLAVARCGPVPFNVQMTLQVSPSGAQGVYGLRLRSDDDYERAVVMSFRPAEAIVELGNTAIYGVYGLDRPFSVEVICREDLIDVCIDGRRCVVNRCPEGRGEQLFFFAQGTAVCYDPISIQPLL